MAAGRVPGKAHRRTTVDERDDQIPAAPAAWEAGAAATPGEEPPLGIEVGEARLAFFRGSLLTWLLADPESN